MKQILFLTLSFNFFKMYYLIIPVWKFENLAIDLFDEYSNPVEKTIYSDNKYKLIKKIIKSDNSIDIEKTLTINNGEPINVEFDDMKVFYDVVDLSTVICPKGSFHPLNETGQKIYPDSLYIYNCDINKWKLKCIKHQSSSFFLAFYFFYCGKSLYGYSPNKREWDGGNSFHNGIFDVKIKDIGSDQYPILFLAKDGEYLKLYGGNELLKNSNRENINRDSEVSRQILIIKDNTYAYFNEDNDIFYFITYDKYSFSIGYSETETISNYKDSNVINSVQIKKKEDLTFDFIDNVEIIEMNFIGETQNIYYAVKNLETNIIYHGVMDFKTQKILFNIDEELNLFEPYSNYEMLAITTNSAYKICLYKRGTECLSSCSDLFRDINGNDCDSKTCDNYRIMPDDICSDTCDTNIFQLEGNECGLCNYFNRGYTLKGTNQCFDNTPDGTTVYNSQLALLKCSNGYQLDTESKSCIIKCYPSCETCSEYSEVESDQKCLTCKPGFNKINNNCESDITPNPSIKEECRNNRCKTCNDISDGLKLCLSCDESKYKKVNYTKNFAN